MAKRTPTAPDAEALPRGAVPLGEHLPRLAYRLNEVAAVLGISRRTIERERSAGRFPKPDLVIGKTPLWRLATIDAWLERGGLA